MEEKRMMILGATGSVGMQAVNVAEKYCCDITGISAGTNVAQTEMLARKLGVKNCAMADLSAAKDLKVRLADTDTRVFAGAEGICEMIGSVNSDIVLNSIIGEAGLLPTLATLESGTTLALANKESLVVAGDIVMRKAKEKAVDILPVDSEHCAIFQCLHAGRKEEVKKILLTAFDGTSAESLMKGIGLDSKYHVLYLPNDKINVKKSIAIALGIIGVVFISLNKGFEGKSINIQFWIGLLCLFLSCASGFYADITVKKYKGKLIPYTLAAMGNLIGGIIIYIISLMCEDAPLKPLDTAFYLNMVWLGIIPAATFAIWYSLISQPGVKVSELNIWRFSIPLSGAIISWIALNNETPDTNTIIGMLIICSSLLVLNLNIKKR